MKRCIKSWIIHYFNISLILIFIVVGGLNAQTSKSNSNNDSLQVKDNFVHEELASVDTFSISQQHYPGEEGAGLMVISKVEMKARRKIKADRFWNNFMLGFLRILARDGCCNCDDR